MKAQGRSAAEWNLYLKLTRAALAAGPAQLVVWPETAAPAAPTSPEVARALTALAGLGLLAWARSRPLAAGVLLGLATATKLYPVLLVIDELMILTGMAAKLKAEQKALKIPAADLLDPMDRIT